MRRLSPKRKLVLVAIVVGAVLLLAGCVIPQIDDSIFNVEGQLVSVLMNRLAPLVRTVVNVILITPNDWLNSEGFNHLYNELAGFASYLVALVVAWQGMQVILAQIRGGGHVRADLLELMTRLAIAFLGFKLTPWAVRTLAEASNWVSRWVIAMSSEQQFADMLTPSSGTAIFLAVFLVVFVVLLFRLILFYALRLYSLLTYTLLSPVAWLFLCGGNTRVTGIWFRELVTLMSTQVWHTVQLLLLSVLMKIPVSGDSSLLGTILLQIGCVLSMLNVPNWLRGLVMETPTSLSPSRAIQGLQDASTLRNVTRWITRGGKK